MLGEADDFVNLTSDMQLISLDANGAVQNPSVRFDLPHLEHGTWIERDLTCNLANSYLITGLNDQENMLVMRTDLSGTPMWTREIGTPTNYEHGVWAASDPNALINAIGNQFDALTGTSSVILAQLACSGSSNYQVVVSHPNYSLVATAAVTLPTAPGALGYLYVTGYARPLAGGNDQVFLMKMGTSGPPVSFLKIYDIEPNSDDIGSSIQLKLSPAGGGDIWIAGHSYAPAALQNVMVLKTDLNGNPVWANNYDIMGAQGPQGGNEYATNLKLTPNNELVLTGRAEARVGFQATLAGDCMLMRIDAATGAQVDWTRVYAPNDYSSEGRRVEVNAQNEYFITGTSREVLSPSQSAANMLAIKTDAMGKTNSSCYHDAPTAVITRAPMQQILQPTIQDLQGFVTVNTDTTHIDQQQTTCNPPPPCECDFTWNLNNCFSVTFNASCSQPMGGNYQYIWDVYCDGNPEVNVVVGAPNHAFSYVFPCGGGTYQVCLKVIQPNGAICNITHTVVVPSTCCGSASGTLTCHPTDPYKYNFTINVNTPTGLSGCSHSLSSAYPLSNVLYSGNTITGCVAVTDPVPTGLNFTVQTNCVCPGTNLPTTCTLPITLATVCCKQIQIINHTVCETADAYDVPVYASWWPPVNHVYQVTWYMMPKPASGVCPTAPWGGQPYQSTVVSNILEPLHLIPSALPGDVCVYAEINLNDGPCTKIVSNEGMVVRCKPNACQLSDQQFCYTGSCITPAPLTLSTPAPDQCISTVSWFAGNTPVLVQTGGLTYQPPCLSMADDQDCYEDFYFTAVVSDACGDDTCTATVRLYSQNASIGTISMSPVETMPFCPGADATLKFTPNCVGEPPMWKWFERNCSGVVSPVPGGGDMNNCYNLNELYDGATYIVEAANGVCQPVTEEFDIPVYSPFFINDFQAVADPCAEVQVTLTASVIPSVITCSSLPSNCTYTYDWYKDGFLIGSTQGGVSATFNYPNPLPLPSTLAGNYYVIITNNCCPDSKVTSWYITIEPSCEPMVMGPCFICDNQSVTLMAQMVLPPIFPCPTPCTFTWYDAVWVGNSWVMNNVIGMNPTLTVSTPGYYFLESDCNGCIKKVGFNLLGCNSFQANPPRECGVVSVQELMEEKETPLHIFPNPTTGQLTIEWTGTAPKNARVFITDAMGQHLQSITVPDAAMRLNATIDDLPSGVYFVKVRSSDQLFTVARLVKE